MDEAVVLDQSIPHFEVGDGWQAFRWMFGLSALCHILLVGLLYWAPGMMPRSHRLAFQAINVDLVALPGPPPGAGAPEVAAPAPAPEAEPEPPAPEPEPAPTPQVAPAPEPAPAPKAEPEAVSLAPKVVKAVKKEKPADAKPVQRPQAPKAKAPDTSKQQAKVTSAIEALRKKVAGQEKAQAQGGGGGGGEGGGGGGGAGVLDRLTNYKFDVALTVQKNWAFTQQFAGLAEHLVTLIEFRVLPSGEITNIKIAKSSGNRYLDESAYRAVVKSNPAAPFPEGINRPYIEIGLECTPSGF